MDGIIFKGHKVYTIGQLSAAWGRKKKTIRNYIDYHPDMFLYGVHYFLINQAEAQEIRDQYKNTQMFPFYRSIREHMKIITDAGVAVLAKMYAPQMELNLPAPKEDNRPIEAVIKFNDKMVDGRSLHDFLGVKTPYHKWLPRMVEAGDFVEGEDFWTKMSANIPLVDNSMNHDLTVDMAKEICMLQHNERGKQARRYFVECEKRLKASQPSYMIDDAIARARAWADEQEANRKKLAEQTKAIEARDKTIEEMKPLAMLGKAVSTTTEIYIGDLAKILTQNGVIIGRNNLFKRLRNEGYITNYGGSKNMPTQRYMESGYFHVKEGVRENSKTGELVPCFTTMVTGKGQRYFINKFTTEAQKE